MVSKGYGTITSKQINTYVDILIDTHKVCDLDTLIDTHKVCDLVGTQGETIKQM